MRFAPYFLALCLFYQDVATLPGGYKAGSKARVYLDLALRLETGYFSLDTSGASYRGHFMKDTTLLKELCIEADTGMDMDVSEEEARTLLFRKIKKATHRNKKAK